MALVKAGPDYCRKHAGVREEDEDSCDFAGSCRACHGSGDAFNEAGDPTGASCPECDGEGREPCDLTPLLYENGVNA